jgi:phosphatidylinositol alpha-1,6-mannosyltransferase
MSDNVLIFSVDYKPQSGGIAEHAYKVGLHMKRRGAGVTVLAPACRGARRHDSRSGTVTYRVPRVPCLDAVIYFFALIHIVRKHEISLVYNATSHPCGLVCALARLFVDFRFTVMVHGHEAVYSRKGIRQVIKLFLMPLQVGIFNRAERVFAASSFTEASLVKAGVDAARIVTIFNGVDLEDFAGDRDSRVTRVKYGIREKRIILTVARLDFHKGHDTVIRALPEILREAPDAVYLIVGDGPMASRLRDLSSSCGVAEKVIFTGHLPRREVLGLLRACDVFAMISRQVVTNVEGFGIVFIEAGALAKPVVGGRSGGIPDAVEDGVTGFLVDPLSPEEVAGALTRILLDADLAERMGKAGFERVKRDFTWDRVVQRILDSLELRVTRGE